MRLAALLRARGLRVADPTIVARTGWTTDELSAGIDDAHPAGPFDLVTLLIGVNNQYRGRSVDGVSRAVSRAARSGDALRRRACVARHRAVDPGLGADALCVGAGPRAHRRRHRRLQRREPRRGGARRRALRGHHADLAARASGAAGSSRGTGCIRRARCTLVGSKPLSRLPSRYWASRPPG